MKRVVVILVCLWLLAQPMEAQRRLRLHVAAGGGGGGLNPIAATRQPCGNTSAPNTCWAIAGVEGGIPSGTWANCDNANCNALAPGGSGTVNTANLETAISGAQVGGVSCSAALPCVVRIRSGSFTLTAGFRIQRSDVVVRGQGNANTLLTITGSTASACGFGVYSPSVIICTSGSSGHIGCTADCGGGPGPDNSATWSAGYAQGTTVITLSSVANLAVGSTIMLDQLDDSADGYPAAGDVYVCHAGQPDCSWEGAASTYARTNRVHVEAHKVTAINGSNVTIEPGVMAATFRSGASPEAWWTTSSVIAEHAGVEDLTIDMTGAATPPFGDTGVMMANATNSWVKGVRIIDTGLPGSFNMHVLVINGLHDEIRNNYFYGPIPSSPTACSQQIDNCTTNYQLSPMITSTNLYQNNIFDAAVGSFDPDDPQAGDVFAYNYIVNMGEYGPGIQPHAAGDLYNLVEGNDMGIFFSDAIHGTHYFNTVFRNYINNHEHNSGCASACSGVTLNTHSRFFNLLGNVIGWLGTGAFTVYQTDQASSSVSIYELGFAGNHSGTLSNDSHVKRTVMRWGNWDNVTSTSDTGTNDQTGVRWCGNSSNTGWVARCGSVTEIPSGITNYPQSIPSAETLPASLYLSAKPGWFGSTAWPPIGPDVSNGDANTSTAPSGGHANKIPARLCYEAATNDANYPSSSPRVKNFDTVACYGS